MKRLTLFFVILACLLGLIGTVSAANTTYYLNSTTSDLSGGADWSKTLLSETTAVSTIAATILRSSTETQYAWTNTTTTNNTGWETGTITVKVNVTATGSTTYTWLNVQVDRVYANGTVIESSATSTEQQLTSTGVKTFNIASKNWAEGASTDRLRLRYIMRNSRSNADYAITISQGDVNSYVVTAVTKNNRVAPTSTFTANTTGGTTPITVQLNDTSTGSPTSWNWSYTNVSPGNGTQIWFSTSQNPVVTFGVGNWSIKLNATNSGGSSISAQVTFVNVSAVLKPVVSFTANTTGGTTPITVQLNDTSTGSPTSWNWSYTNTSPGNGTQIWFSTLENPVVTFGIGNWLIKLNATNAGGTNSSTQITYVNVTAPPVSLTASFNQNVTTGSPSTSVQFTDTSTGTPTGWAWWFGDENWTLDPWVSVNASSGWIRRSAGATVALPDGSVLMMGGAGAGGTPAYNDTWRSTNNGTSWTRVNQSGGWVARYGLRAVTMADGSVIITGGTNDGTTVYYNDTWRSTDQGSSWVLMNASSGWVATYFHGSVATPDGSIYKLGGSAGGATVWQSTNNGATWVQRNTSPGWASRAGFGAVGLSDNSIVVIGGAEATDYNDTWRSTNQGATWVRQNQSPGWQARDYLAALAMPDDSIILTGGQKAGGTMFNDAWRSIDKGVTWTLINSTVYSSTFRYHGMAVTTDGSVILTNIYTGSDTNVTYRFNPAGSSAQSPEHTYTANGNYSVVLLAHNAVEGNSTVPFTHYVNVSEAAACPQTQVVFYTNGSSDGQAWRAVSNSTYSEVITGVGTSSDNTTTSVYTRLASSVDNQPDKFRLSGNAYYYFNTSSIPDTATVVGATLSVMDDGSPATQLGVPDYGIVGVLPYQLGVVKMGDYSNTSRTRFATDIPTAMLTGVYQNWSFNVYGLSNISKTTFSNFSIAQSWYINQNFGGVWLGYENGSQARWYTAEAPAGQKPFLTVNYTDTACAVTPLSSFLTNTTGGTTPIPVQFTDTSTNTPTSWNWTFQNTTGNNTRVLFSTAKDPLYTFGVGNWSIKHNATNAAGVNVSTQTTIINVSGGGGAGAAPVASFNQNVTSGSPPTSVQFTDTSTGTPTGWAWYFGDENWTQEPWTVVNASSGWIRRSAGATVALPDGSILTMGGAGEGGTPAYNDTWRSTNNGASWTLVNASGGWIARYNLRAVTMADGSVILTGGANAGTTVYYNDTWRSTDQGSSWVRMNASSGWVPQYNHGTVATPDGSVYVIGGSNGGNTTWKSTNNGTSWTLVNASCGWLGREGLGAVVLSDGSIVIMGGDGSATYNDTWRSTNGGVTWVRQSQNPGWQARYQTVAAAMPDDSIVLVGGVDISGYHFNDSWRSTDKGVTWSLINTSIYATGFKYHSVAVTTDGSLVLTHLYTGSGTGDTNVTIIYNPAGSTAQSPQHTYTANGNYTVTLLAHNAFGGDVTTPFTNYVNVSTGAPVVSWIIDHTVVRIPQGIIVNDTSTNTPTAWQWSWDDGTANTTTRNATHSFQKRGAFHVILTASNAGGDSTSTSTTVRVVGYQND